MSALITGGTGFIGAHVSRILAGRGEGSIVAFDVCPSWQRLDDLQDRVQLVQGDLGDFRQVLNVVERTRPSVIYHMGGVLSILAESDPGAAMRANVLGTFHVLEAARTFDVPQVLFSSSIGTFGRDVRGNRVGDRTLQRPEILYGATKLFGETLGLSYRRKYGLDFRGVRYPIVIGPGVRSPGVAQDVSWMIEESLKGKPYAARIPAASTCPAVYVKDAAAAIVKLADAPREQVETVNYLIAGLSPAPRFDRIVQAVKDRVPTARIEFKTDVELRAILRGVLRNVDDRCARTEWGWSPEYTLERSIDDFIQEVTLHPARYA